MSKIRRQSSTIGMLLPLSSIPKSRHRQTPHYVLRLSSYILILIAILVLQNNAIAQCGLGWRPEVTPLPFVNSKGATVADYQLADILTYNGTNLPLIASFRPAGRYKSLTLGSDWILPILDSRAVMISEDQIQVLRPDGKEMTLVRSKISSNTFTDGGGWVAIADKHALLVTSACGDSIRFLNGTLADFKYRGQEFKWIHAQGLSSLNDANGVVLSVARSDLDADLRVLKIKQAKSTRSLNIHLADVHNVRTLNAQNIITGISQSLVSVESNGEILLNVKRSIDKDITPSIAILNDEIKWEPNSGRLLRYNEWNYDVTHDKYRGGTSISRHSKFGDTEKWENNGQGTVTFVDRFNSRTVTRRFSSGILNGRIRDITETKNGETNVLYRAKFAEDGSILESEQSGILTQFIPKSNEVLKITVSGRLLVDNLTLPLLNISSTSN